MSSRVTLPLPIPEQYNSSRVLLIRHGVYDPQKLGIQDIMKVCCRKYLKIRKKKILVTSGRLYDQRYFHDG